jgi:hypothetical protein
MEIGFFVWHLSAMPANAIDLAYICKQYGIKRLAFKLLDGTYRFNVPLGDEHLQRYFDTLWVQGITVEGWGYHYPDYTETQSLAIRERCKTFGIDHYHLDIEAPWKRPGSEKSIKTLLNGLISADLEILFCSYRFPSYHQAIPFNAAMSHLATDAASPQVYFAGRHNPLDQLAQTYLEYSRWNKPIFPIGPTFGESFTVAGERFWWEPTSQDITNFRLWCVREDIRRIYWYSLDYVLKKERYDWLEAATGIKDPPPPPEPPGPPDEIEPLYQVLTKARPVLNVRAAPRLGATDLGNLPYASLLPITAETEDWLKIEGWIHKDWVTKL